MHYRRHSYRFEGTTLLLVVFAVIAIGIGIASTAYTVEKCGFWKTMLLGKSGTMAAMSGMCDDEQPR